MREKKMNRLKPNNYSRFKLMGKKIVLCIAVFTFVFASTAFSETVAAGHQLGDLADLEGGSGVEAAPGEGPGGADVARLELPGVAEFRYPEEEGWTEEKGHRSRLNPAGGWDKSQVLALDVNVPQDVNAAHLSFSLLHQAQVARQLASALGCTRGQIVHPDAAAASTD